MNTTQHFFSRLLFIFILFSLSSASLAVNYCLDINEERTHLFVNKDHQSANDSNPGTESAPFASIQGLLNRIQAGQCGWVRETQTPYTERYNTGVAFIAGPTFTRGGNDNNSHIVISGYPGERPIIDQQGANGDNVGPSGEWFVGFIIPGGTNYVTIKNFEIRNTLKAAIFTDRAAHTNSLHFEDLYVHHVYYPASDIDLTNVAGLRLDHCDNCVVKNSIIHDVYSINGAAGSGMQCYQCGNLLFENNYVHSMGIAVYIKEGDTHGLSSPNVRNNIIHDVDFGYQVGNGQVVRNAVYSNNLLHNIGYGLRSLAGTTPIQSSGLVINNNTIIDAAGLAEIIGITDVSVTDNIMSGATTRPGLERATFITIWEQNEVHITEMDYNIYHNRGGQESFVLDNYGSRSAAYHTLSSWQNALNPSAGLHANPDANSSTVNPDFKLQAGMPSTAHCMQLWLRQSYNINNAGSAVSFIRAAARIGAGANGVFLGSDWDVLTADECSLEALMAPPLSPSGFAVSSS